MEDKGSAGVYMRTFVSVDCVVFGFDGVNLNVLLVERDNVMSSDKLPGSIVYFEEDTDRAAERVLFELTGIKKLKLKQYKCFSSIDRASAGEDQKWLQQEYGPRMDRLVTVAYLALTKVNRRLNVVPKYKSAKWCPVDEIGKMPFDHNLIVRESLNEIRNWISSEPALLFELLPSKFTASELRKLYESIYDKVYDVRNFHKKIASMDYVVPLEERQKGVAHRAARYYKFDRVQYNKRKAYI